MCLLCPIALFAQQERQLTVEELFRLGTENSLRLKSAHITENIAEERMKSARIGSFPSVNVGATVGYIGQSTLFERGLTHPVYPDMPDWSHNYNVEVIQSIYQGGRIRYTIERASLERQLAALTSANDQAEIKILLMKQYLDLFMLYKQEEVFCRTIEESEHRLADIRKMRQQGIVTRNDEIRSELQLTNDRLSYQQAIDNISIVSQQIAVVLGLDETLILRPDSSLLSTATTLMPYDEYVDRAYDKYPELSMTRHLTSIARNDIRIAKADYLPSVALRGANTLLRPQTTTMQDMFSNNWNVTLNISFNLSSFYQNKHRMREAQHMVALRENDEQRLMQDIRINVKSVYIRHKEALDRVEALRLSVRQAEENYRIVRNRYMNQLSILTDLLDAVNVRLDAELQLTVARTQVIYTYYQMMRACGDL